MSAQRMSPLTRRRLPDVNGMDLFAVADILVAFGRDAESQNCQAILINAYEVEYRGKRSEEKLLKAGEVAKLLGRAVSTVHEYGRTGKLTPVGSGRGVRYRSQDVERLMNGGKR